MYKTSPDIFGDAQALPIKNSSIESVALLDVLEHLHSPESCIKEINRVLIPNGNLCIQVPFIYPVHDSPYDYQRWTVFGLTNLLNSNQFEIDHIEGLGTISITCALMLNLGITKCAIQLSNKSGFFLFLIPFLIPIIFISNITGFILNFIIKDKSFMPFGYLIICKKK